MTHIDNRGISEQRSAGDDTVGGAKRRGGATGKIRARRALHQLAVADGHRWRRRARPTTGR